MKKLRILFATTEIEPFLRISQAAETLRVLPQGLQEQGHEIRILMPKFGVINERRNRLHEVVRLSGFNIRIGTEEKPVTIKVATVPNAKLQVYFLDNEDYFQRKSVLFDDNQKFHSDNDERAIFFCKGVLETVKKLAWVPHIIHCHDWMTSLIPLYLKTHYSNDPFYKNTKAVYTVYNNEDGCYENPLPNNFLDKARIDGLPLENDLLQEYHHNTFLGVSRGGIKLADAVTKGAPSVHSNLEEYISTRTQEDFVYYDREIGNRNVFVKYYEKLYNTLNGSVSSN